MASGKPKDRLRIALIPGDGIGPDVIPQAKKILELVAKKSGPKLEFETFPFSADEYLKTGRTLTEADLNRFKNEFDAILFGALGDARVPDNRHAREILLGLRFKLDLYVNLRPVRLLHDKLCPLKGKSVRDVQFMIVRENTEDLYRNIGGTFAHGADNEVAIETMINTRRGVERILRAALDLAREKKFKRVCMVDKSNVLRYGHELWQRLWKDVGGAYPELEKRHLYVDAAAMEMVRAPEQFDVIVTSNLFGDILSDLGAQLQGGMGMAASVNYRPGGPALFEPVHGSAPNLAGKGIASPFAAILTAALMLEHFGYSDSAKSIEAAVAKAFADGVMTPDLGGKATTSEAAERVATNLGK